MNSKQQLKELRTQIKNLKLQKEEVLKATKPATATQKVITTKKGNKKTTTTFKFTAFPFPPIWLLTTIITYAHKIPIISRIFRRIGIWYGRTTWLKLLLKIRKWFVYLNALILILALANITNFSTDNIIAGCYSIGVNYFLLLKSNIMLLLKYLVSFSILDYGLGQIRVEPLIFNGKLISIKVIISDNDTKEKRSIIFKDSFLLLNNGLRKLCETFSIINKKMFFPIHFFNYNIIETIKYEGAIPDLVYWGDINPKAYTEIFQNFKGRKWNFELESINYCMVDCISLHEIVIKFNDLIYKLFKLNIHEVLTLPSLAMKIFRTHYMPKDTIYQILGKVEKDIRESYTGGAVDVYIPHNRVDKFSDFKLLKMLDVNSLYPAIM